MTISTFRLIATALVLASPNCLAQAEHVKQLWSVDLSKDADFKMNISSVMLGDTPFDLFFLDSKRLALSFNVKTELPVDGSSNSGVRILSTVNVPNGQFENRLRISVPSGSGRLAPAADGNMAVLVDHDLHKYSADLHQLAEVHIPSCRSELPKPDSDSDSLSDKGCSKKPLRMDITPGEKQIVVEQVYPEGRSDLLWINPIDLSINTRSSSPWSQSFVAGNNATLRVPGRGRPWLVNRDGEKGLCDRCWRAYFVTDDLILLEYQGSFQIVDLQGQTKASGHLVGLASFQRARDAPRFVYVETTGGYTGPLNVLFPKLHFRVHVFDWKQMKEFANWTYTGTASETDLGGVGTAIAISPGGENVALLVNGRLTLYSLK